MSKRQKVIVKSNGSIVGGSEAIRVLWLQVIVGVSFGQQKSFLASKADYFTLEGNMEKFRKRPVGEVDEEEQCKHPKIEEQGG